MRRSERIKRDRRIVKLRTDNPLLTYQDIGEKYGLTPSAIARIIKRNCPETANK